MGSGRGSARAGSSRCVYLAASWVVLQVVGELRDSLGRVSEELGETDAARRSYEAFVIAYEDADPELQPRVEEARQALVRLMDSPAGTR